MIVNENINDLLKPKVLEKSNLIGKSFYALKNGSLSFIFTIINVDNNLIVSNIEFNNYELYGEDEPFNQQDGKFYLNINDFYKFISKNNIKKINESIIYIIDAQINLYQNLKKLSKKLILNSES
jgi:hypothetical protein